MEGNETTRVIMLAIRRALLLIVAAIEQAYGIDAKERSVRELKMQKLSQNVSAIAALALIATAVVGVILAIAASVLGHPPGMPITPDPPSITPTNTATWTRTPIPSTNTPTLTATVSPTAAPTRTATASPTPPSTATFTPTHTPTLASESAVTLPMTGGGAALYALATNDLSGVLNLFDLLLGLLAGGSLSFLLDSFPQWRNWKPPAPQKALAFVLLTALLVGMLAGLKQIVLLYFDALGPVFQSVLIALTAYLVAQLAHRVDKLVSQ